MKKLLVCAALLLVVANVAFAGDTKYDNYCSDSLDRYAKRPGGITITSVFAHQDDLTVAERIATMFEKRGFEIVYDWTAVTDDAIVLRMNKGKDVDLQIVMQATITQGCNETTVEYKCLRWYPYGSCRWFDLGYDFPSPCRTQYIRAGIKDVEKDSCAPSANAHLFVADVKQYRDYVKEYRASKKEPCIMSDFSMWKRKVFIY